MRTVQAAGSVSGLLFISAFVILGCGDNAGGGRVGGGGVATDSFGASASAELVGAIDTPDEPAETGGAGAAFTRHTVRDSAGVVIVESAAPAWETPWVVNPEPLLRIGAGGGGTQEEFHRVGGALRLSDGRLVIANRSTNELRWYSASGVRLFAAGGTGDGPGEFRELSGVIGLSGDTVAAYAFRPRERRLALFGPDGTLLRTETFDPPPAAEAAPTARLPDGSYLFVSGDVLLLSEIRGDGAPRLERRPRLVHRCHPGADCPLLATFPGLEILAGPRGGPLPFGRNTKVIGHTEGWVVVENARSELQFRSAGGEVERLARTSARPRNLTATEAAFLQTQASGAIPASALPTTVPTFGNGLHVDTNGNVWVEGFALAGEAGGPWSVFGPDGVWLGSVAMPPAIRVLWIGDDSVLGLGHGPFDVELVTLHRLEKP